MSITTSARGLSLFSITRSAIATIDALPRIVMLLAVLLSCMSGRDAPWAVCCPRITVEDREQSPSDRRATGGSS